MKSNINVNQYPNHDTSSKFRIIDNYYGNNQTKDYNNDDDDNDEYYDRFINTKPFKRNKRLRSYYQPSTNESANPLVSSQQQQQNHYQQVDPRNLWPVGTKVFPRCNYLSKHTEGEIVQVLPETEPQKEYVVRFSSFGKTFTMPMPAAHLVVKDLVHSEIKYDREFYNFSNSFNCNQEDWRKHFSSEVYKPVLIYGFLRLTHPKNFMESKSTRYVTFTLLVPKSVLILSKTNNYYNNNHYDGGFGSLNNSKWVKLDKLSRFSSWRGMNQNQNQNSTNNIFSSYNLDLEEGVLMNLATFASKLFKLDQSCSWTWCQSLNNNINNNNNGQDQSLARPNVEVDSNALMDGCKVDGVLRDPDFVLLNHHYFEEIL